MSNLRAAHADCTSFWQWDQGQDGNRCRSCAQDIGSAVETITPGNVYHVPEATMKLFSIRAAVAKGIVVHFSQGEHGIYCVQKKDGQLMVKSFAGKAGTFAIVAHTTENKVLAAVESPKLRHRRYGHLRFDNLAKPAAGNLVVGMNTTAEDFKKAEETPSSTCINSRQHEGSRTSSDSVTERPLELLHTVVCGPMQLESLGGSRWLATYLDCYSKLSVVKALRYKSEVPAPTKEVVAFLEKQSGQELVRLRSDNGTEHLNRERGDFLKQKEWSTRRLLGTHLSTPVLPSD